MKQTATWLFLMSLIGLSLALLPWWGFTIPCAMLGLLSRFWLRASWQGFAMGFLMWSLPALLFDLKAGGLISYRLSAVLHLPHPVFSLVLTGLFSGLLGLLASFTFFNFKTFLLGAKL